MNYTLQLFLHVLERPPIGLSQKIVEEAQQTVQRFIDSNASEEVVEEAFIEFGFHVWPYWQAERTFLVAVGGQKHAFLLELPEQLRNAWVQFEREGGSLHDVRHGQRFEDAFTPEENILIENAMIEAHAKMREEAKQLAFGERHGAYMQLVHTYTKERDDMVALLEELTYLKQKDTKWQDEIDETIQFFRRGFAELEVSPTKEDIRGKIEWYTGHMSSS